MTLTTTWGGAIGLVMRAKNGIMKCDEEREKGRDREGTTTVGYLESETLTPNWNPKP